MTILSKPVASHSVSEWESIAGGANRTLVQRRTEEGIQQSRRDSHHKQYTSVDLYPFRIVVEEDEWAEGEKKGKPDCHRLFIVAIADSSEEIMSDWQDIKNGWRATGGAVKIQEWADFFQGIIRLKREEEEEGELKDDVSLPPLADVEEDSGSPVHVEPLQQQMESQRKDEAKPPLKEAEGPPLSRIDVWAGQFVSLWLWGNPSRNVLLCLLLLLASLSGAANCLMLLALCTLASIPSPFFTQQQRESNAAKTDALFSALGLNSLKAVRSFVASVFLLNYASSALFPPYSIFGIFDACGAEIIVISLFATLLFTKRGLLKKEAPLRDESAEEATRQDGLHPAVAKLLRLCTADGWKTLENEDGVRTEAMKSPWCSKPCYRSIVFVPGVSVATVEAIFCADLGSHCPVADLTTKRDPDLLRSRIVEDRKDEIIYHSMHQRHGQQFDIVSRMAPHVYLTKEQQVAFGVVPKGMESSPCSEVFVQAAISHNGPPVVEEAVGFRRGKAHCFGVVGQQHAEGVTVVYCSSLDLVADFDAEYYCKMLRVVKAEMEELGKGKGRKRAADQVVPKVEKSRSSALDAAQLSAIELAASGGWNLVKEKNGIKYETKSSDCWEKSSRFEMFVKGATAASANALLSSNGPNPQLYAYKNDSLPADHCVAVCRDFVARLVPSSFLTRAQQEKLKVVPRGMENDPGSVVLVHAGADGGNTIPVQKGYVRGVVHRYGIVVQQEKEGIRFVCCMSLDSQGLIPQKVMEVSSLEQLDKIAIMRKQLLEIGSLPNPVTEPGQREEEVEQRQPLVAAPAPVPKVEKVSSVASLHPVPLSLIELATSGDWNLIKDNNGIKYESKPSEWCDKKSCRYEMFVEGVTAASAEALLCDDPDGSNLQSYAYKNDALLDRRCVVKKEGAETFYHSSFKTPVWGVTCRDFVTRLVPSTYLTRAQQEKLNVVPRGMDGDPSSVVLVHAGLDAGDAIPEQKGYVRGAIHRYGALVQQEKKGIRFIYCLSLDPCGMIPRKVVEISNSEQVDKLAIMRKQLLEIGPLPNPVMKVELDEKPDEREKQEKTDQREKEEKTEIKEQKEAEQPEGEEMIEGFPKSVRLWADLNHITSWTLRMEKKGVIYCDSPVRWSPTKACRFTMFVESKKIRAYMMEQVLTDFTKVKKYDRLIAEKKKIKDLSKQTVIAHSTYKSPVWGIAARDFVTVATTMLLTTQQQLELKLLPENMQFEDKSTGQLHKFSDAGAFIHCGYDASDEVPQQKNFTRGHVFRFGFLVQEVVDCGTGEQVGVYITNLVSIDPCGSIPTSIADATNAEQIEKLNLIKGLLNDIAAEEEAAKK